MPQRRISAYDLSPREARLAVAISNGMTLKEISQAYNISLHTVRTQLKAVFRKTDTSRQSELIRLLLSSGFAFQVQDS